MELPGWRPTIKPTKPSIQRVGEENPKSLATNRGLSSVISLMICEAGPGEVRRGKVKKPGPGPV